MFFHDGHSKRNSDEKSVLSRLLKHSALLAACLCCGNHKIALLFKHLLLEFTSVKDANATFLSFLKLFYNQTQAINFCIDHLQISPVILSKLTIKQS